MWRILWQTSTRGDLWADLVPPWQPQTLPRTEGGESGCSRALCWGSVCISYSGFWNLHLKTPAVFRRAPPLPVGVFLRVFPQKSAELFHTSSVPEMAAGRRAGSAHRCPDTCPEGAVCWPCRPLRRKCEQFWVQWAQPEVGAETGPSALNTVTKQILWTYTLTQGD